MACEGTRGGMHAACTRAGAWPLHWCALSRLLVVALRARACLLHCACCCCCHLLIVGGGGGGPAHGAFPCRIDGRAPGDGRPSRVRCCGHGAAAGNASNRRLSRWALEPAWCRLIHCVWHCMQDRTRVEAVCAVFGAREGAEERFGLECIGVCFLAWPISSSSS